MAIEEMKEAILNALIPYLKKTDDKTFDEELLSSVVDGVFMDARQVRRYPSFYTETMILSDMEKHLGVFRNVTLARYNKIGAEYEKSHNEGDVSRSYIDDGAIWGSYIPLAVVS